MTAETVMDAAEAIQALEHALSRTPRAQRPHEHAAIAYRLGLAHAESPVGPPPANLRRALACYEVAADLFDPRFDPVEHARVLNAAGAAHRGLGDQSRAAALFEEASRLLTGRGREDEQAAALNNLGLARTDLGEAASAVEAFDAAAALFDTSSPEGRRGRAAALLNRGQAHATGGGEAGLEAALADYEQARAVIDVGEAPYHWGLVHHSLGVALLGLAELRPGEREPLLGKAQRALAGSLVVFAPTAFPFQHALAKHNLGLAHLAAGGVDDLRRALACFDDAVGVLDPRLHAAAWRGAYAGLERAEQALAAWYPEATRVEHFAALLAGSEPTERTALVRERLTRLLALPDPRRHGALVELALATAGLGQERAQAVMESELSVLMELPVEYREAALHARVEAHRRLSLETGEEADRALDQAVSGVLTGPQLLSVRDFLYSLGFERP
jgi:tetratricopeptide (TPR) repeat protein